MAKYLLESANVNWLAVLALLTFILVFVLAVVLAFGRGRDRYAEVERTPLFDGYPTTDQTDNP